MSKLSFTTAVAEHTAGHDSGTPEPKPQLTLFDVDGRECAAVRPIDEAFLLVMSAASSQASKSDMIFQTFQFLDACMESAAIVEAIELDEEGLGDEDRRTAWEVAQLAATGQHLKDRLLARKDPFGVEQVFEIMQALVGEWVGRPTGSRAASSRSRQTTGRKSTGTSSTKASTGSTRSAGSRRAR